MAVIDGAVKISSVCWVYREGYDEDYCGGIQVRSGTIGE